MKIIRASEIGTYLYCQRAWWYQRSGHIPENQAALEGGLEIHQRHGIAVMESGCLHSLAFGLLLAAAILVAIYLTLQMLAPAA